MEIKKGDYLNSIYVQNADVFNDYMNIYDLKFILKFLKPEKKKFEILKLNLDTIEVEGGARNYYSHRISKIQKIPEYNFLAFKFESLKIKNLIQKNAKIDEFHIPEIEKYSSSSVMDFSALDGFQIILEKKELDFSYHPELGIITIKLIEY